MSSGQTAYVTGPLALSHTYSTSLRRLRLTIGTGGASGIGKGVAEMLAKRGVKVCISDQNIADSNLLATQLPAPAQGSHIAVECNAASWDSQVAAFTAALKAFGRIDLVYPIAGIGEKRFMPNDPSNQEFVKPMLSVIDVDLTGVVYTVSLAVQQMRRQEKDAGGFRGKIAVTASVCGFYCVPTVPIYTAAKHGVTGFVRSYGKYLPEESITLNAVCPNVVRTHISTDVFYDKLEPMGLLTPIQGVIDAFASFLDSDISGECMEVGPNGGFVRKAPAEYLDEESKRVMDLIHERSAPLQRPEKAGA